MSIRSPEENDHSSTPESNDQYRYGGLYFHLREMLMRGRRFSTKAYLPLHGGVFPVTNIGTSNGGARIVFSKTRMLEPDESDPIYFTENFLEEMEIDKHCLQAKTADPEEEMEKSGIYRRIRKDVYERIMKEPPLDERGQKQTEKKAG